MSFAPLRDIFLEAVRSADPYLAVARHLHRSGDRLEIGGREIDLARLRGVVVVGAGKATAPMAAAVESLLLDRIERGLVVVKEGHRRSLLAVEQVEASHPVPDARGLVGTERVIALARGAGPDALLLCLLSGGASSLLVAPAPGLTLGDLAAATEALLASGVDVAAVNTVRKHLSDVAGGRLAVHAHPAPVVSVIVSDVIGDRLEAIGSGPTVPDPSTYGDALAVIRGVEGRPFPPAVIAHLERGAAGRLPETPKGMEPAFAATSNHIVCSNRLALEAAAARARTLGFDVETIPEPLAGEAREAAADLAARAIARRASLPRGGPGLCLLAGGETTVTVRGGGLGGRNQEFALAFARAVAGRPGIACLCAGTDGTDGPTDAAGAAVDGDTAPRAVAAGLDPAAHLAANDSHGFFSRLALAAPGAAEHLKTGPTGTNVMDVAVVLVSPPGA